MQREPSIIRRARIDRRITFVLLGVGFAGTALTLLAGDMESLIAKVGAVMVVGALAIGLALMPVGVVLHLLAMRERRREQITRDEEIVRDLRESVGSKAQERAMLLHAQDQIGVVDVVERAAVDASCER